MGIKLGAGLWPSLPSWRLTSAGHSSGKKRHDSGLVLITADMQTEYLRKDEERCHRPKVIKLALGAFFKNAGRRSSALSQSRSKVAGNELLIQWNILNKALHEWYVPPSKFSNIPFKSLASFVGLIKVDGHQIESILDFPFVPVQSRGGLLVIIDWEGCHSLLMCKD